MKNRKSLLLALLAVTMILFSLVVAPGLSGGGGINQQVSAAPGSDGSPISWSPTSINRTAFPGSSFEMNVTFSSSIDLESVDLQFVPEIAEFITISPEHIATVGLGVTNYVHFTVDVSAGTLPGVYEGTLHVRTGKRTVPHTLKIVLQVQVPPSDESLLATVDTQDLAGDRYDTWKESYGVSEASHMTVEWLEAQDIVADTGISSDGTIWIVFSNGIHAAIYTGPPETLGAASTDFYGPSLSEAAYVTSTGSSIIYVGNNRALVLDPFYHQLSNDPQYYVHQELDEVGDSTYLKDNTVTVEVMKTLYQYGVVSITTHGAVHGEFLSENVGFLTGEEVTPVTLALHLVDLMNGLLSLGTVEDDGTYFEILPAFITNYAAAPYPESLVYLGACDSLYNWTLAATFLNNGALTCLGFTEPASERFNDEKARELFYELVNNHKTVGQAFTDGYDPYWPGPIEPWGDAPAEFAVVGEPDLALKSSAPIAFPDPNLEAAIREAIGKPTGDIYPSDLAGLTSLDAQGRSIVNLTGLEHCTDLMSVNLRDNQISNISPLANLTNLSYLYLGENQISNISPIAHLINLRRLFLYSNQISDVSPLASLTSLSHLHLSDNQINDISPSISLTSLTYLALGENQISDISPLAGLTSLTRLFLISNQISDISPLAGLTSLTDLALGENQISDISPLASLTSLTDFLILAHNQISDISPLANLTNLTQLYLGWNQISDISPLAGLTSLADLGLLDNLINDISALAGLTSLTGLSLWHNQISDISALAGLTNLTDLRLGDNQISDISALAGLTSLTDLRLGDNQISDIEPLVNNPGLAEGDQVNLDANPLSSDSINIYIPQLEARGVIVDY
jgi:Leucine-rich repeat (LRR) protein